MNEHQLDQVLQTAARRAQRAAAAVLDIEGQLAKAKAAACAPVQDGQAGIPDTPEPGPEGRCAAAVIALRLTACKLDRALNMARDLTRSLLPFYQHDLDALNERAGHPDLGAFRSRVLFPRSRGSRLSRSRARGIPLVARLEYEFAPAYQTLHSIPDPVPGIARVLDRDRRPCSGHALACDRVLNRDRALALDLALDLARDLASELDAAAGASSSNIAPGFLLARDKILELEAVMYRALDLAVSLDRARAVALDRDAGITPGREQGGDADRRAAGTWEAADTLSVALDRALSLNPVSVLASIAVDVSGLDLSRAGIDDLDALGGVTFTAQTTWPPGITQSLRAQSAEIRPGIYQVRDAGGRDAASPAIARQAAAAAPSGDYRTPAARQADTPVPCPHGDPDATRNSGCELAAPPPLR